MKGRWHLKHQFKFGEWYTWYAWYPVLAYNDDKTAWRWVWREPVKFKVLEGFDSDHTEYRVIET